jgi:hypothetical protein
MGVSGQPVADRGVAGAVQRKRERAIKLGQEVGAVRTAAITGEWAGGTRTAVPGAPRRSSQPMSGDRDDLAKAQWRAPGDCGGRRGGWRRKTGGDEAGRHRIGCHRGYHEGTPSDAAYRVS